MSTCERAEAIRDYAFDELPASEWPGMDRHIAECAACASDLDQLRLTTAALRVLPEREVPQRIAFVSDKVFQPSWFARVSGQIWSFASVAVLAVALIITVYHRDPAPASNQVRTVVQKVDVSQQQIDAAVTKAVAQVHQEDAKMTKAAIEQVQLKYERQQLALADAVNILQKRLDTNTLLASSEIPNNPVAGQ